MELVSFAKEVLQNVAEHAASYRLGQTALRHCDRVLWVLEKCARWAVPPPLDQDERPQPELVRPLPWVFFLILLVTLRITRESISLVNLVMGKPPLRSADVVTYIQSKRRYLRTLKYQGGRLSRARAAAPPPRAWGERLHSLFEFTMCFRRSHNYGNNNTTSVSNNEEVLVVKRSKRARQSSSPAASANESTMERLLEKMMVDLAADSDDDSSFTLTNVTSIRSDGSETTDSDQDTVMDRCPSTTDNDSPSKKTSEHQTNAEINFSPNKSGISTPERSESPVKTNLKSDLSEKDETTTEDAQEKTNTTEEAEIATEDIALQTPESRTLSSPKEETQMLLQSELSPSAQSPKTERSVGTKPLQNRSFIAFTKNIFKQKHAKSPTGVNGERRDSGASVAKAKSTDKTM
ncbi:serine/threonine-protein kinase pakF isoform X2 [Ostrinia furnacalis]|uniref:serine/threonine-protein kinase pakF isoform X2 n=1 Tax=Ostrinia furnacalis TaxID=93504 RepID=UPI00103E6DCD|nr:serine/threonine-protein kinase pakF isoform X2 [Ostrinia furnacalis]